MVLRIILIDKFNNNYCGFCKNKIVALMVLFVSGNLVCSDKKNDAGGKPTKEQITKFLEWRRLSALEKASVKGQEAYDNLHSSFRPTESSKK